MIHGRRLDIGLGSTDLVSFTEARSISAENCAVAPSGRDPRRQRSISFAEAEPLAFEEKAETLRGGAE